MAFFVEQFQKSSRSRKIQSFLHYFHQFSYSVISPDLSPKLDLSIDGMRSQQFSEGIFVFLMLGIAVFSAIVFVLGSGFGKSKERLKKARLGEVMIFGVIILGIVAAIIMAAMQMLGGYLF